jgi:hypothetical protein
VTLRALDPAVLRAALWTLYAVRHAERELERAPLESVMATLPRVPQLPDRASRGVNAVLRRRDDTCLERALVLQAWEAAHGRPRDLVIGVTSPRDGFKAHAWLEHERVSPEYAELMRRAPAAPRLS